MFDNIQFREACVLLLLSANTWKDIREGEILLKTTIAAAACGLLSAFFCGSQGLEYALGFIPGSLALGISLLSHGGIGMGDALVLLAMGAFLPWDQVCGAVLAALLLCALCSLYLLVIRRCSRRKEIPFLPFLLAGFLLTVFRNCTSIT